MSNFQSDSNFPFLQLPKINNVLGYRAGKMLKSSKSYPPVYTELC